MVCKYYQEGSCVYGNSCRFDHVKLESTSRNRSTSGPKPVPLLPRNKEDAKHGSKMVTLTKHKPKESSSLHCYPDNWADAPVFIPGQTYQGLSTSVKDSPSHDEDNSAALSYSEAAQTGMLEVVDDLTDEEALNMLCPFAAAMGDCPFVENCCYIHGLECEYCGNKCLHPGNPSQQEEHRQWCVEQHEKDMEHSFAVQRSEGVTCGICLDTVKAKLDPSEQRFGILTDCNHAFCLSCIRRWRNTSHSANKIVRACPICRVPSPFVTPSDVWIDDSEEKKKLIEGYKGALRKKPCRYFAEGKGTCPFGSSCFYKHAYSDGRIEETRLRHCDTAEGGKKVLKTYRLWDFLEAQESERTGENEGYVLEVSEDSDED